MSLKPYSNPRRVRLWSRMVIVTWALLGAVMLGLVAMSMSQACRSIWPWLFFATLLAFMLSAIPTMCLGVSMRCDVCRRRFAVEHGPAEERSAQLHWQDVVLQVVREARFTCRYCSTEYGV